MQATGIIPAHLNRLGFNDDEIALYLALVGHGAMTMSELARRSGVERTAPYRMLDDVAAKGLVKIQDEQRRRIIYPARPQTLQRLVDQEEIRIQTLRRQQAVFSNNVEELMGSRTDTDVNYYRGIEGIKQIQWNMLHCKSGVIYSVMDAVFEEIVEKEFFNAWGRRFRQAGLRNEVVYSEGFISSIRKNKLQLSDDPLDGIRYYYIAPEAFTITHHFDTYDDYVIYYNWGSEDPYAVEIKNKHIAFSNRQLIEMLIKQAVEKPSTWRQLCGAHLG